jgi:hypothetical protein
MSSKTTRIAAVAATLAAVGLMSIAASASAAVTPITSANCPTPESTPPGTNELLGPIRLTKPVNGSLTVKKLNQSVPLAGGAFGGLVGICLENPSTPTEENLVGSITEGTITFPPFTAPLKILGIPSEVGMEIVQFGPGEGTITSEFHGVCTPTACNAAEEPLVELNVQAQANITFTTVKILGLTVPTKCKTAEPVHLPFVKKLTLIELLFGTTITGTATMPRVSCEGPLGIVEGAVLTALFSGPENPFSLTFGNSEPV